MSKIALTPSATGTGVFSILSPATNTDRTLTLPDEAGTVLTSASSLASANLTGTVTVSGGNVGIGTASPSGELDVTASKASAVTNLYVRNPDNSGGAAIRVQSQTDAHQAILGITDAGSGGRVGTLTNDDFYFVTNNTERLRIDSSGYFRVNQPTSTGSVQTEISFPPSSTIATRYNMTDTTYNNAAIEFRTTGPARVGYIYCDGSSTSYSTTSDYRLKTNLQPMTGASDRVLALKPVNFEWISTGTRVDGFLAHEAQAVVPEAVHGTKDAMRDEEYEVTAAVLDADGRVVTEAVMGTRSVPDYQGIDQSKLVPLLTAALQEALTEISALKVRVAALEAV
jgi:hypothetical protein